MTRNLKRFLIAAKRKNLVYDEQKCCVFSTRTLRILENVVSEGLIKPAPETLKPLLKLPLSKHTKTWCRIIFILVTELEIFPRKSDLWLTTLFLSITTA